MASGGAESDYARLKRLFNEVADLPDAAARRARLAALGTPGPLAERVLALAEPARDTRLRAPVAGVMALASGSELQPGDRLGAWTLTAELGEGGMGRVFAADRSDGHYRQRAAIKLLRSSASSAEALALLARERQILAGLTHPNIARLLDGGTTPQGRPYLVMEFVDGVPIDAHCRRHQPAVEARLALWLQVCEAVAHAHRQLVVHCDLKPSNVLVTADGRAMLLDFGIARLQGEPAAGSAGAGDSDHAGSTGPQALTPRYASPEQLAGATPTIATDVHGLGRLLHELLAEPGLGPAAPRRPEWQAIVDRATAADPDARYDGVPALVADVRRFQQHRALAALPRRPAYRAAKALRRHWPWALASGLAALALAGFTWQLVQERDRAVAAEAQARHEQATARQVSDFVISLFQDADPGRAGRLDLPASALLDRGRERVAAELREQPALRATLQGVLGQAYDNLGQRARALELYAQAAALEADPAVARPLQEAKALGRMAVLMANDLEAARAEAPARRALALRQAALPPGDPALADAMNDLGTVLAALQRFDEARPLLTEALALRRRAFGERSAEVATSLHNLGHLQQRAGDAAAAEPYFREALAIKRERFGDQHRSTLNSLEGVATALVGQQRLTEAVPMLEQLVQGRQQVHGAASGDAADALNELGVAEHDLGWIDPAVRHLQSAAATQRAAEGGDSPALAIKLNNLAHALADDGQAEMARNAFERSLALRLKHLGEDDLAVARARHNLARWWLQQGQPATARPLAERALAVRAARLQPHRPELADSRLLLAELHWREGRSAAAQALLQAVVAVAPQLPAMPRARLAALQARMAPTPADAAPHWQAAVQALEAFPAGHPARLGAALDLAEALAATEPAAARQRLAALAPALSGYGPAAPLRLRHERLRQRLG